MAQIFLNNARATLAAAIDDQTTSLEIIGAVNLPSSLAEDDWFLLTLFKDVGRYGQDVEIIKVTAISGTTLTVERGQEGTDAVPHATDDLLEARWTAGSVGAVYQYIDDNSGPHTHTSDEITDVDVTNGVAQIGTVVMELYTAPMRDGWIKLESGKTVSGEDYPALLDLLYWENSLVTTSALSSGATTDVYATAMAVSPDSTLVAVGLDNFYNNRFLQIVSVSTGNTVRTISSSILDQPPNGLAFSPDGAYLVVAHDRFARNSSDCITILDTSDWSLVNTTPLITSYDLRKVVFSPDGSTLYAIGNYQNDIKVIDTATWTVTSSKAVDYGGGNIVSACLAGDYLVVGTKVSPYLRVYDLVADQDVTANLTGTMPGARVVGIQELVPGYVMLAAAEANGVYELSLPSLEVSPNSSNSKLTMGAGVTGMVSVSVGFERDSERSTVFMIVTYSGAPYVEVYNPSIMDLISPNPFADVADGVWAVATTPYLDVMAGDVGIAAVGLGNLQVYRDRLHIGVREKVISLPPGTYSTPFYDIEYRMKAK